MNKDQTLNFYRKATQRLLKENHRLMSENTEKRLYIKMLLGLVTALMHKNNEDVKYANK